MNDRVKFGLLGPFEFSARGRRVSIRSANFRTLLAALLVEPGRIVSQAELIESIWNDRQPDYPRRALHVCVTRARAALIAAGAPQLIVSGAGGYKVDVPPDSVDLTLFRRCMDRADAAADRLDAAGERAALNEALDLWRGEPLVDISSDYLRRVYAVQFAEQRLHALERRIDLDLEAGLYAEVEAELAELTAKYPLRERLLSRYMTVLHHGGRRSDALNAYHGLRLHLADEFGIEPGDELQQVYLTILGGSGSAGSGEPAFHIVPRQIPRAASGFVGRAAEVDRMHQLLDEYDHDELNGSTVLVITGMAGVGKTALATHWSRRVVHRFPDGQLWLDLRGYDERAPATPQQTIASILRALGVPSAEMPTDLDSQIGLYRSMLDGRRMLVVLDNANGADQVLPLLPGDARAFVLITSRDALAPLIAVGGARSINLSPFTSHEARLMLEPRLGADRLRAEQEAASRLIDSCYGLPLALAIVAARAVARPNFSLSAIDQQLVGFGSPLDRFTDPNAALDMRAIFSWSYRSLSPKGKRLFRSLGRHPMADVSISAAASLVGATESQIRPLLDELTEAHLVIERIPDRFSLHDLVRAYAAELTGLRDDTEQRLIDLRRMLGWLTGTALNGRPLMQPSERQVAPVGQVESVPPLSFDDERAAREWFEAELDNLVVGIDLAFDSGFDDLCWRLAYATWVSLHLSGSWDDLLRTHAVGLRAAERLGDRIGQALMLTGMGAAYRSTGRTTRAVEAHRAAIALFRAAGDTVGIANALSNLGAAHRDAGAFEEALDCGRRSLTLDEALDQPGNTAISLYQIAMTLIAASRPEEAIPNVSRAVQLFRKIGHRRGEARSLQLSATARIRVGRQEDAIEECRMAADIYRDLGDRWYEAAALTALGDALYECQCLPESRDAWTGALTIYDALGASSASDLRARLKANQIDGQVESGS